MLGEIAADIRFLRRFAVEVLAFVLHLERRTIDIQKPLRWIDQTVDKRAKFRRLALDFLEEPIADDAEEARR